MSGGVKDTFIVSYKEAFKVGICRENYLPTALQYTGDRKEGENEWKALRKEGSIAYNQKQFTECRRIGERQGPSIIPSGIKFKKKVE